MLPKTTDDRVAQILIYRDIFVNADIKLTYAESLTYLREIFTTTCQLSRAEYANLCIALKERIRIRNLNASTHT